jgi:hypothetical protein
MVGGRVKSHLRIIQPIKIFFMATRLYRHYGLERLVTPGMETERKLLKESKEYVLKHFPPGKRRQKAEISKILQCYFNFYSLRLDSLLRKVASREFMEFVLHQYDLAAAAWRQTPDEVTLEACQLTSKLSVTRRGMKHLAERISQFP